MDNKSQKLVDLTAKLAEAEVILQKWRDQETKARTITMVATCAASASIWEGEIIKLRSAVRKLENNELCVAQR